MQNPRHRKTRQKQQASDSTLPGVLPAVNSKGLKTAAQGSCYRSNLKARVFNPKQTVAPCFLDP
jgi:hypothetical protein